MKKILLLTGLFSSVLCSAQNALISPANTNPSPAANLHFDKSKLRVNQPKAGSRSETFWLNYGTSIDAINGNTAELNGNYLFPDSTGYGEFGTGNFAPVWVHHLGDILDVKSQVFNIIDGVTWNATNSYTLDSMSIVYGYTRNTTDIDTLVVTLITNVPASNLYSSGFLAPTATNYGTDTLSFKTLNYSMSQNMATGTGRKTFKIPLTDLDSDPTNYIEKAFAVPGGFNVAAGKLLACDIMFKPGYTLTLGEHVDDYNAFLFASYEELGANTFPTYTDCNYQSGACDYNSSSIVPQDVRYATAGTWNGKFIPSYAYTDAYSFEHHLISYRVTSPAITTGVDATTGNNFALEQNVPNPMSNITKINYSLKSAANNVSLAIYNVAGVKVYEKTQSNLSAGNYSVDVTENFTSGMYFYSLTVDGNKVTKKMTVAK